MALPVLAVVVLSLAIALPVPFRRAREISELSAPPDTVTWASAKSTDTLRRGMALSHALDARGLDTDQVRAITRQLRAHRDPRLLKPGTSVRFATLPNGVPYRIRFELNPDSVLDLVRVDSTWVARVEAVPFLVDTVRVTAFIESSLWAARLGGDLGQFSSAEWEALVYDLADVLAWKVDFTRDVRHGDAMRVVLERKIRADGSVRSRHFLAIEFWNGGQVFRAFPDNLPGGGYAYFDEEGRSLRGAYLRYPVPYRITSRFTGRRFHPILKRYRAHEGIDYGAPYGTPVEATASGIVTQAGWSGGYGRRVELRHPNGVRTRYAHLSAIAAAIRPGARVVQGEIIGKVGASGLATGPHLHYEFLVNGHHTDPLTVRVPSAPSIDPARMAEFRRSCDQAIAILEDVPVPSDMVVVGTNLPPRGSAKQR